MFGAFLGDISMINALTSIISAPQHQTPPQANVMRYDSLRNSQMEDKHVQ